MWNKVQMQVQVYMMEYTGSMFNKNLSKSLDIEWFLSVPSGLFCWKPFVFTCLAFLSPIPCISNSFSLKIEFFWWFTWYRLSSSAFFSEILSVVYSSFGNNTLYHGCLKKHLEYKEIEWCQVKGKPLGTRRFISVPSGLFSPNFRQTSWVQSFSLSKHVSSSWLFSFLFPPYKSSWNQFGWKAG